MDRTVRLTKEGVIEVREGGRLLSSTQMVLGEWTRISVGVDVDVLPQPDQGHDDEQHDQDSPQ